MRLCTRGTHTWLANYLGSKSTFTLGQFGGHGGRAGRAGGVLHVLQIRGDFPLGRVELSIEALRVEPGGLAGFLATEASSIGAFRDQKHHAVNAERERWIASGQAHFDSEKPSSPSADNTPLQANEYRIDSHIAGNLWQVEVVLGERVAAGDVQVILASMNREIPVVAPFAGVVREILVKPRSGIGTSQRVVVLERD